MKIGLTTRAAVAADAEAICTVLRQAILESCVDDHRHDPAILDAWLGNKQPAQVAAWIAVPANYMVVAERADGIVGVALINQAGKLALCHVLPLAQRQGVGKALLDAAEARARSWGVATVRIHGTINSRGFYARFGYLNAGKDKTCYGVDSDLLWKQLDAVPGAQGGNKRFCSCNSGNSQ
ncbi:GNAT family N-acetyltransferase [Massilia sp. DWR3-1-1]|uniref:GNAT family N-acetyltransferase n=1 Tax=Massilia sp. DWR3-1-1 TaxID=2804559 RepID=UPI003CF58E3D